MDRDWLNRRAQEATGLEGCQRMEEDEPAGRCVPGDGYVVDEADWDLCQFCSVVIALRLAMDLPTGREENMAQQLAAHGCLLCRGRGVSRQDAGASGGEWVVGCPRCGGSGTDPLVKFNGRRETVMEAETQVAVVGCPHVFATIQDWQEAAEKDPNVPRVVLVCGGAAGMESVTIRVPNATLVGEGRLVEMHDRFFSDQPGKQE